jgi:hypothetical protein
VRMRRAPHTAAVPPASSTAGCCRPAACVGRGSCGWAWQQAECPAAISCPPPAAASPRLRAAVTGSFCSTLLAACVRLLDAKGCSTTLGSNHASAGRLRRLGCVGGLACASQNRSDSMFWFDLRGVVCTHQCMHSLTCICVMWCW